ncbi:MAG TPA: DUF1615 domain-containing protein [Povalibacter sp.]
MNQRLRAGWVAIVSAWVLSGCGSAPPQEPRIDPDVVRHQIRALIPASVPNRDGWAVDIFAAFETLEIRPTPDNLCAVLAVTQQESGFQVDPVVPDLATKARREIDTRAAKYHVPDTLVTLALKADSADGRSYAVRLKQARTERELSVIFEDFIGRVPLGKQLFADLNPVRTGGPMQVSIAFAEDHANSHHYPYPLTDSVRHEVFTRRGGLYFGTAHLLGYPASYEAMLYRFADFNAGHYASRNAAFQKAVSTLTKSKLALDGDLLLQGGFATGPSQTELAVRKLATQIGLTEREIRRDLEREKEEHFEKTDVYEKVFALADARSSTKAPRAVVPRIRLQSVKITRNLTTEWFANRVDARYRQCLVRAGKE